MMMLEINLSIWGNWCSLLMDSILLS